MLTGRRPWSEPLKHSDVTASQGILIPADTTGRTGGFFPKSGYGESPFAIHFRTNVAVKAAKAVHKG
jgi:hypothetical protein